MGGSGVLFQESQEELYPKEAYRLIPMQDDPNLAFKLAGYIYEILDSNLLSDSMVYEMLKTFKHKPDFIKLLKTQYRIRHKISLEAHVISELSGDELNNVLEIINQKGSNDKVTIGFAHYPEIETTGEFRPANTFIELIRLIRVAEDKLIAAGYLEMEERLNIISGIFYGTTWSMDAEQSGANAARNYGFSVYTNSDTPINPESILGTELFNAIKGTPQIKDQKRSVDVGHLIIGLLARLSSGAREGEVMESLIQGTTGLEAVTWIGDLGGGAGMVSMRRVNNPNKRVKNIVFNADGNDYGSEINLEGDIAAFVVAHDKNSDEVSYPDIKKYGYISDAITEYLLNKEYYISPWKKRVRLFIKMIGGKIKNNEISNQDELKRKIAEKIFKFGGLYAVLRIKTEGNASEYYYREASKHIIGAAVETATIFVDMLNRFVKGESDRLVAHLNPSPNPPGNESGILKSTADKIRTGKAVYETLQEILDQF